MTPLHDQVLIRLYVHVYLIVQTHISERVERATERETGQRKTDRCVRYVRRWRLISCRIYQYYVVRMASEIDICLENGENWNLKLSDVFNDLKPLKTEVHLYEPVPYCGRLFQPQNN